VGHMGCPCIYRSPRALSRNSSAPVAGGVVRLDLPLIGLHAVFLRAEGSRPGRPVARPGSSAPAPPAPAENQIKRARHARWIQSCSAPRWLLIRLSPVQKDRTGQSLQTLLRPYPPSPLLLPRLRSHIGREHSSNAIGRRIRRQRPS